MQSNKESFWEQVGMAFTFLLIGPLIGGFWCIRWLLKNRTKWLVDQLPHRAKELKKQDREIKALEEKLGLKRRDENDLYYDRWYYNHHFTLPYYDRCYYDRYYDDSFFGSNSYIAKRRRYLEELREKVSKGWKDPEIIVAVKSEHYHPFHELVSDWPRLRYYVFVAVKVNSSYDCGPKKRNLLKYHSGIHLDECGNPMDYDVVWESKEIAEYEISDITALKKRKEVVEFLKSLRKVGKAENIEQESICNKI